MNRKRFLSLLLASLMLVLALAACGGSSSSAPSKSTGGGSTSTTGANGEFADYSNGFEENVTIKIPVYDRAFEGWNVTDNFYTRWIQTEFGDKYNVNVEYISIARQSEVTDYQQLLASHQAPDIIFHYDMPQALAYYGEGVMQELNYDEMKNYMPTVWDTVGSTVEEYGTVNNEKVFFFAARPAVDNFTTLIRKDWVEKAGYKLEDLTSLEVFNEMLLKWKELGLGVKGEKLERNSFIVNYPYRDWPVDEAWRALYSELSVSDLTTEATEEYLRNLNYQYNNGLIDTEFYLRDEEGKYKAEFVAGKTGTYPLYLSSNTDVISSLLANDPNAQVAVMPATTLVPEGKKPQQRAYWPFGMIMGINYETTDESRIATWMFLEWMSQPENLFYLQNGIEGENYTLNEEGLAVKNADFTGESMLSQNNNKDYWCLITETQQYGSPELNEKANRLLWTPEGHDDLVDDLIKYYNETEEYRTPDALFTVQIESVAEYKADLNNLWQELYVQCVRVPEADFDATYEAACKTYLDAGYQEILDEKQAAIDAGNYVM